MIDALRQRKRQHLTKVFVLLAVAFVLSAGAAFLLVTAGKPASVRGVLGALLALVALALAGAAGIMNHRFPGPADRHLYPPGQLGIARVLGWVLAAFSVGPVFIALTVVDWS
jgi:hypothetical protein